MTDNRTLLRDPNLHVIFSITLMVVLGVSSITPVFPKMVQELGIAPEAVGLLITAYALPGIFLMPVLGVLADRVGRKRVLVPALVLFAVAGTACAFARDFELLLLFRFFQGMGGASLGSLTATLVGDLYRGRRLTEAMGYKASVLSLGSAAYPALGGALAVFGWYVPFALPILGLGVAGAVLFHLETVPVRDRSGFSTYLAEAAQKVYDKKVIGLYLATLVSFAILYGAYMTFIPLHLGARFGSSPLAIGPIMSIGSLTTALTASRLGILNRYLPRERLLTLAFALFALSFLMLPFISRHWWAALPVGVFGIGQGLNYPVVLSLLAGHAPTEHRAVFMSVNGMVIRMGQAMGPVIMAGVSTWWGMDRVFHVSIAICGVMILGLPRLVGVGNRRTLENRDESSKARHSP
jgi:predicted MFS family arabinose efflux permease